jgi:hypothetical protein
VGFLMIDRRKSSGETFGSQAAASIAAFRSTVFLLGVPRWRPPRLSPGFDPLGIAFHFAPTSMTGAAVEDIDNLPLIGCDTCPRRARVSSTNPTRRRYEERKRPRRLLGRNWSSLAVIGPASVAGAARSQSSEVFPGNFSHQVRKGTVLWYSPFCFTIIHTNFQKQARQRHDPGGRRDRPHYCSVVDRRCCDFIHCCSAGRV